MPVAAGVHLLFNQKKIWVYVLQDCTAEWTKISALLSQIKPPDLHTCALLENGKKPYYCIQSLYIQFVYSANLVLCSGSQTHGAWPRSLCSLSWLPWAIMFCISRTVLTDSRKSTLVLCAVLSGYRCKWNFWYNDWLLYTRLNQKVLWVWASFSWSSIALWSISFNVQNILIIQINQN